MHRLARWLLTRPLARRATPRRPARLGVDRLEDRTVPAVYDLADDFSTTSNPNGLWTYGWRDDLGSEFYTMTERTPILGVLYGWAGHQSPDENPSVIRNTTGQYFQYGSAFWQADGVVMHPGPLGQYAVVRFTAPAAGLYQIDAAFASADVYGATTDTHVLVNGAAVTAPAVVALGTGDTVEFAVGYGSNGTFYNDSTSLAATVSTVTPPTVTVAASGSPTEAGPSDGTFTLTRTGSTASALTVTYTLGGTATPGDDYAALSGTATFAAGSSTAAVTLTPYKDNLVEDGGETVTLTVAAGTGYTVGTAAAATLTIADDPPLVSVAASPTTLTEGQSGTVTVSRTGGDLTQPLTVTLAVSGTADAPATVTVVIPAYSTSEGFVIAAADDAKVEPTEFVTLTVLATAAHLPGGPASATVAILDDDAPGPVDAFQLRPAPPTTCPPLPNGLPGGGAVGVAAPGGGGPSGFSAFPVRFADGAVALAAADLASAGAGADWALTRSWSNRPGYADAADVGNGWADGSMPRLVYDPAAGTLAAVAGGTAAEVFDPQPGGWYASRSGSRYALSGTPDPTAAAVGWQADVTFGGPASPSGAAVGVGVAGLAAPPSAAAGRLLVVTPDGAAWEFYDFDPARPAAQRGRPARVTDPDGTVTTFDGANADGRPTAVTRAAGGVTERAAYTYLAAGPNAGRLAAVAVERSTDGGATWQPVRSAEYAYYDGVEDHGSLGDLKTATVRDAAGAAVDVSYYRYYVAGEAGGYAGGLKYALGPAAYARLAAAAADPAAEPDAAVAGYADHHFEYDADRRVTREVAAGAGCSACAGGQGEFTYAYTASGNAAGYNAWAAKTVEGRPDGSVRTVYTNFAGQVLLSAERPAAGGPEWVTYYRYDAAGRLVLEAAPSAVTGYDDTKADLVNFASGNAAYLADAAGLVTVYEYYAATTATDTAAGGAAGYQKGVSLRRGELGVPVPQSLTTYYARTAGGVTVHPVAAQTVYSAAGGAGAITTAYAYTWHSGTVRAESVTATRPVVSTGQNGSGTASQTTTVYDVQGRPVWQRDAGGFLTYAEYDDATGAVTKVIVDVDTAQTGTFAGLPGGWVTPVGGGLHLTSTYEVDELGRVVKATDPAGRVDYTVYDDANREVRYYPGWDAATDTPTGPTTVVREDRGRGYTETLTMSAAPAVVGGRPTGAEAVSGVQSLARSYVNAAGQVTHSDAYFSLAGVTYSPATALGTEGVNFDRTRYQYDPAGRLEKTTSPSGTIYRTVFDGQGRAVSEWVGTDDTPTAGFWSPTNTAGTDLVKVREYEYDGGGVGDGNLTRVTEFPGLGADPRVTDTWFDWRNRPVAVKAGVEATEGTSVNRPLSYTEYDNLGRAVASELYDGDGVTPADGNADGVPDRPSAGLLRARSTAEYDPWGRAFRTHVWGVDPASGAVSAASLTTDTWFDARGFAVKTAAPGGLVTKMSYDGAGRLTATFATDGGGDSTYADALTVTGDVVLSQAEYQYDGSGNVVLTTTRERFHDAAGTGALGTPAAGVPARVSYAAAYYDSAGRLTDAVAVGTNGGAAWTRPGSVPARSDAVLVSSAEYDAGGRAWRTTDARGVVNVSLFDLLGRPVSTIENYVDGVQGDAEDRVTWYAYGPAGLTSLTALSATGVGQVTEWVYGVSTGTGSGLTSNDVVGATRWPDPLTGLASSAEQEVVTVNALGQAATTTDRNGTKHTLGYDAVGRLAVDEVTLLGVGVDGAVRRVETAYDGRGNVALVTGYSATAGGSVTSQVKRVYNGLGQLTEEWQAHGAAVTGSTPRVGYTYTEMAGGANHSRLTGVVYPDGKVLAYDYGSGLDATISRLTGLSDASGTLEAYSYLGLATVVERTRPQADAGLTYVKLTGEADGDAGDRYTGLDRFGRVADQRWVTTSTGAALDRYQYGYDRAGNRLWKDNLVDSSLGEVYAYDGTSQLTSFVRGTLNGTRTGVTGTPGREQSWDLGGQGNWDGVTTDGVTESRTHDAQNRVTGVGAATLAYDANGNLTADEQGRGYVYDAWNRLAAVEDSLGVTLKTYSYDGLGRRVSETAGAVTTDLYHSAGWQVLEERVGGAATQQYVYSPVYVDALVLRDRDTDGNGSLDERLWVQQDANWNVTSLVGTTGAVVERYLYDPYGAVTVLDANWAADADGASDFGWSVYFQGFRWDGVTGHLYVRHREYSVTLGRPIQSDPLRFDAGDVNFYRWEGNNPVNYLDPSGLGVLEELGLLVKENGRLGESLVNAFSWLGKTTSSDCNKLRDLARALIKSNEVRGRTGFPDAGHQIRAYQEQQLLNAVISRMTSLGCGGTPKGGAYAVARPEKDTCGKEYQDPDYIKDYFTNQIVNSLFPGTMGFSAMGHMELGAPKDSSLHKMPNKLGVCYSSCPTNYTPGQGPGVTQEELIVIGVVSATPLVAAGVIVLGPPALAATATVEGASGFGFGVGVLKMMSK